MHAHPRPLRHLRSPAAAATLATVLSLLAPAGPAAAQTVPAPARLEVLSPRPGEPASTVRDHVHVLGRTAPGTRVTVGGEPVTVFSTGVFARDRVPLQPGANTVLIEATTADGQRLQLPLAVERQPAPAPVAWPRTALWLDGSSLRPAEPTVLAPGEAVEVAVRATPGQRVEARLPGQKTWQPLAERGDGGAGGRYRGLLAFTPRDDVRPGAVQLRVLPPAAAAPQGRGTAAAAPARGLLTEAPGTVGQWRADPERLYATGPDGAELLHGLHEVRLGGPFLAELPPGTLLAATGRRGDFLRVQLAPDTTAWVAEAQLLPAEPGTPAPQAVFTSVSVSGDGENDVVNLPLAARVPYAVNAFVTPEGRQGLDIDVYNAQLATTWVSHRATATLVRQLTVEQAGPGRVRLRVLPQASTLWGWRVERTASALRVWLRPPPRLDARAASPLAGLRVAVEAGHGSSANLGAVGATGVPEKDINRLTADALQAELQAAGAQVVVVREGDENPKLRERARRVAESQAQLFVSVHANSTDTGAGFLRVSGASMFYKHAPHHALAAAVQKRVLAATGLDDFGVVGNFNYTPVRLSTWAPAVLVEQAFVSHPGDEARLLDPAFRARLAKAVREGLEDFLKR
jgi:N-acetylmuramoyl-L-alanine amidase